MSYEILADVPVYVVAAPLAHVAHTTRQRPPNSGSRTWKPLALADNDPEIPRRYGATWAVVRSGRLVQTALTKVLLVTLYFPPAPGGGVQRPLKIATHLPDLGIETHVLAPDDQKWIHRDDELPAPTLAWVHRVRFIGPRGRKPAEELHGTVGVERYARQASLFGRRLLVPDENVSFNLTAIPAAIRIVRQEGIDVVVVTTSPRKLDPRDRRCRQTGDGCPLGGRPARPARGAIPTRDISRLVVRVKEQGQQGVSALVARNADAIVAVSEAIAQGDARAVPARAGRDDRERFGLRRLRRPPLQAGGALPDHPRGLVLRPAGPAPFPDRVG